MIRRIRDGSHLPAGSIIHRSLYIEQIICRRTDPEHRPDTALPLLRCGAKSTRRVDRTLPRRPQPYMPVDTRAGIPSGIGLCTVIHPYRQHIVGGRPQPGCQLIAKGNIPVGPLAQVMTVDPYLTV